MPHNEKEGATILSEVEEAIKEMDLIAMVSQKSMNGVAFVWRAKVLQGVL